MGFGDEIMAIGHAESASRADPSRRPVVILDARGNPRRSPLWARHPSILSAREAEKHGGPLEITNGPGCRPYIRYPFDNEIGLTPSGWNARDHRGTLHLGDEELDVGRDLRERFGPYVVVGPDIGKGASPNKAWGWLRYVALAGLLRDLVLVRLRGPTSGEKLPWALEIEPRTFAHACGALAGAGAYVGAEGGLHHAAAYLSVPAVVIFGGFVSPEVTGYPEHANLTGDADQFCGKWVPCVHCANAMEAITPGEVAGVLRETLSAE